MDWYVLCILIGLLIGFTIAMTGVGGGVLMIPALVVLLGMPPSMAVGTASLYSFLTKVYATFEHVRLKTIDYSISVLFLFGAIPSNVVTSKFIVNFLDEHDAHQIEVFQRYLSLCIASLILVSVFVMIIDLVRTRKIVKTGKVLETKKTADEYKTRVTGRRSIGKKILGVVMGGVVGALMGATSIGGAVFTIPLLFICFGLRTHNAVGSSILITVVLTLVTSLIYLKGENLDIKVAFIMWVASFPGVFLGSKISITIGERLLKKIVIGFVLISTMVMFFR